MKTRLARAIGAEQAATLAAAMLSDVWAVLKCLPGIVPVLAAAEAGDFGIDFPAEAIWLQQPGDLGWRIESILRRALHIAPAAIALGADSPLVTAAHLTRAIESLQAGHTVTGPCDDGGFYLLGVNSCPPGLLAGISWSSERTLLETECRLRTYGLRVARIESLFDVDTAADIQQLRSALQNLPPAVAPRTRRWLDETQWSAS